MPAAESATICPVVRDLLALAVAGAFESPKPLFTFRGAFMDRGVPQSAQNEELGLLLVPHFLQIN
jgi:hypothetical protein